MSISPSALRIMALRPDRSTQAMAELVVPRSIPTAFSPLIAVFPLILDCSTDGGLAQGQG